MQEDEEDEENSLTNKDDKKPASHKITMMIEENDHTGSQNKIDVLEQEFRNEVKNTMANDHKTPYAAVFEKAERKLLNRIQDPDTRAQLRQQLPSRSGFKTAAYTAKKQGIP